MNERLLLVGNKVALNNFSGNEINDFKGWWWRRWLWCRPYFILFVFFLFVNNDKNR